ncbi:MAG: RecQ family ATP-dependent DNA helicase [Gemmatimonadaceae bacterium]
MSHPMPSLEDARDVLKRHFGFSDMRDGQKRVVAGILERRDTLVVLPTGGGKSLCYQLPALVLPGLTVVVSPLIALMDDQVQALRRRGIAAAALHSGLSAEDEAEIWRAIASGQLKLLYLSPERLLVARTLSRLSQQQVALLAIDEAHCVCEWGYDFRPSYLRLVEARRRLRPSVTVALTATATPATRTDIIRVLELERPLVVVSGFDRPNLFFAVERIESQRERLRRIGALIRDVAPAPCIVYAGTRGSVDAVTQFLRRITSAVDSYHAGRLAGERSEVQQRFLRGDLRILVATNAFGMGVDKPDVRLVAHLAPPGSIEDYYQEAGRASRDGAPGRCVVLSADSDRRLHDRFLEATYPPEQAIRDRWSTLCRLADAHGLVNLPLSQRRGSADLTSEPDDPALMALARYGVVTTQLAPVDLWRVRLLRAPTTLAPDLVGLPASASVLAERLAQVRGATQVAVPIRALGVSGDRGASARPSRSWSGRASSAGAPHAASSSVTRGPSRVTD